MSGKIDEKIMLNGSIDVKVVLFAVLAIAACYAAAAASVAHAVMN